MDRSFRFPCRPSAPPVTLLRRLVPGVAALLLGGAAWAAEPLPDDPLERRCWLESNAAASEPRLKDPVSVHFTHLRTGWVVRNPFWVEFGVRGMGVIPAGKPAARAGHHHLLIDTPLPLDHKAQIPFSDTHRHFGKGQTGTLLDLKPGTHTLRLLFADHDHRPYFVYSPEIRVVVEGRRTDGPIAIDPARFAETCARWYADQVTAPRPQAPGVYVKNLRSGESVASPFVLSLGVQGAGVAPAGSGVKDTGHFAVQIASGKGTSRITLGDGRTETLVSLPNGEHEVQPMFVKDDGTPQFGGAPLKLVVTRQMR
jgi:Domain of unknown function (DUF4399)